MLHSFTNNNYVSSIPRKRKQLCWKHLRENLAFLDLFTGVGNGQCVPCDQSLKMLKNGKAPGPNSAPTNLVKDVANFIVTHLATIFNASSSKRNGSKRLETCKNNTSFSKMELQKRRMMAGRFRFSQFCKII